MTRFMYWLCWAVTLTLDWIPGYCRYYTVNQPAVQSAGWYPRFGDLQRHWAWRRRAQWGFRLLAKLGLVDLFVEEDERRFDERNRSSGS